jgi:SAM-dependent methyltransferase
MKSKHLLFISWGGDEAREIAAWLKEHIFEHIPGFDVYFSEQVPAGAKWRNDLNKHLVGASHCLGILTDGAVVRPWFLYELFVLQSRLEYVPILRFCEPLSERHPLAELQMKDGLVFDNILDIARTLLKGREDRIQRPVLDFLQDAKAAWDQKASKLAERQKMMLGLRHGIVAVNETVAASALFPSLETNSCMRELARKTLDDLGKAFSHLKDSSEFSLPKAHYPEYLIHIQESLKCRTMAVAVIDDVEEFWAQQTGVEILKTTCRGSSRVFVFENSQDLLVYRDKLAKHRAQYDVFVLSKIEFNRAVKRLEISAGDFSVLTDPATGSAVTAYYDNSTRSIRFTGNPLMVRNNRLAFDHIKERAHLFPADWSPGDAGKEQEYQRFVSAAFHQGLFHSDAIPIHIYDAFEEDHPFYLEMHKQMLDEFRERAPSFERNSPIPILEIGAGTGHFTKKLAQKPFRMEITPLEPDPRAQEVLNKKLGHKENVLKTLNDSALKLDQEASFAFIFSSFSEHHIQREEKKEYFSRIRRALVPGGYFIIGDEFLRPHEEDDESKYVEALAVYHQYIIDEALKEHHGELAKLEKAAWESGKPDSQRRVDYKVSVESYLRGVEVSGLMMLKKYCISPPGLSSSIGGIYVIVFQRAIS